MEHVEVVLGSAMPPRTPPNILGIRDEQQGGDGREGKRCSRHVFDDRN